MISLAQMQHLLGSDLRPASGKAVAHRTVSGVHISELADPTPYLEGGELLLTTGIPVAGPPTAMAAYVQRLADRGVSGLGLGLGAGVDEVPDGLVELCRAAGLELLIVPDGTPFMNVSRAYWDLMAKEGQADLAASLGTQTALARAATRPDALSQVVRALAQALGGWVAYLPADNGPETLWPTGNTAIAAALRAETARLNLVGTYSASTFQIHGTSVVEYPVMVGRQTVGFLAIGAGRKLTPADRQVILTVCVLLSLKAAQQQEIAATSAALGRAAAKLFLNAHVEAGRLVAADLDITVPAGHVRLLVARDERDAAATRAWLSAQPGEAETGPLAAALADCDLRYEAGDLVYYILDATTPANAATLQAGPVSAAEAPAFAAAVVGDPIPMHAVSAESGKLAALVRTFDDGRLARAGAGDLDPRARGWVDALRGYPRADLVGTVRSYLRHRGQWEGAARELGVHRNSLRHRMGIAAQLLQADPDDPDVAANLWLALRGA
ncbi:PucR family transcriptional regulator [Specibacter cremeus]|uniref:PucR family transcriptional regulator n=1 Tax=Specibacter cremeus TaxID=1629051 RepID=UPI000F7834D6|nr:PucR family transcriptional regulator [Specibacter cremeus]